MNDKERPFVNFCYKAEALLSLLMIYKGYRDWVWASSARYSLFIHVSWAWLCSPYVALESRHRVCNFRQGHSQPCPARCWEEGEESGDLLNHKTAKTSPDVGAFLPHPPMLTRRKGRRTPPWIFFLFTPPSEGYISRARLQSLSHWTPCNSYTLWLELNVRFLSDLASGYF